MAFSSRLSNIRESIQSRRTAARRTAIVRDSDPCLSEALETRRLFSGLPAGYQDADVGIVGATGSSSFSSETFTVNGAGSDIAGAADAFHFAYTTLTGNGSFVARVTSVNAANPTAPFGINMRSSLDPTAANMFVATDGNSDLFVNDRTADGGAGSNISATSGAFPIWLKLIRTGNSITAYESTDGMTYNGLATDVFTSLPATIDVGLAVASHDTATLATGTFDNVALTQYGALPTGLSESDIGSIGSPGSSSFDSSTDTFSVSGAGDDLFGASDAFHYVYKTLFGDGSLIVQETGASATDTSAPAGIDLRSSLSPTAANLFIGVRPDQQVVVNDRTSDGGTGGNLSVTTGALPTYLKLTRSGSVITASTSTDGTNFTPVASDTLSSLSNTVYVGMAVASHNVASLASGTFAHLQLVSAGAPSATLTTAPTVTAASSNPYDFTVTFSDSEDINASTISNSNLVVTGPGGYNQPATLVSTGLTNGTTVAARYSVPSPTTNGSYTVTANANSVLDVNSVALAAGSVGMFTVNISGNPQPPTATLSIAPAVTSTTAPYVFAVTYSGPTPINTTTFGNGNIAVSGPGGYSQAATFVSFATTQGNSIAATYSVPAPTTNGTYTVTINNGQVTDTNSNPVPGGAIGTFAENISGPGSIAGSVVNSLNNSGIAGRTITLNTGAITTTDSSGNFSFANLPAGTYTLSETLPSGVIVTDPTTGSRTVILTAGETATGVTFANLPAPAPTGADLAVTLLDKTPSAVIGGAKGAVKVKIINIGSQTASGTGAITLLVSPTGLLSAANTVVMTASTGSLKLKTNASKTISIKFTYPTGLASGSYHLIGVANSSDSIAETNFANNTSASNAITIAPAFTSLAGQITKTPATLVRGKPGSATVLVINSGNVASTSSLSISLYESPIAGFQSGDILLGTLTRSKNNIKPGGGKVLFPVKFKTSAAVTTGSDHIVAVINGDTLHAVVSPTTVVFS